jgi:hypothetical protein
MLEKLLDVLLKSLENGNWLIVIIIVAIAVIVNLRAILEFIERWGTKREEYIKEALKNETIVGATRTFLEEELNCIIFKKVTEISADRFFREKIKDLINRSNGDLQPYQFARARKHLQMKGGKLDIVITRVDRAEHVFNFVSAGIIAIFSLFFFMLPASIKFAATHQIVIVMGSGVLMFFFALFLVLQTVPLSVAKRIEPIIKQLED